MSHVLALAMARPDRPCRLASRTRAALALGDGPAQTLAAAAAKSGGGTSGAEIKMSTPVQAAKRRTALGAVDLNALVSAPPSVARRDGDGQVRREVHRRLSAHRLASRTVAARSEMNALKNELPPGLLETHRADFEPSSASPLGDEAPRQPRRQSLRPRQSLGQPLLRRRVRRHQEDGAEALVPKRLPLRPWMYQTHALDDSSGNAAPVGGRSIIASPR